MRPTERTTAGATRRRTSVRLLLARGVTRGSEVLPVAVGGSALVVATVATVLSQTGL